MGLFYQIYVLFHLFLNYSGSHQGNISIRVITFQSLTLGSLAAFAHGRAIYEPEDAASIPGLATLADKGPDWKSSWSSSSCSTTSTSTTSSSSCSTTSSSSTTTSTATSSSSSTTTTNYHEHHTDHNYHCHN